ncbi:TRAP transporter large permease subunit [Oleispirillum naphthae]|uniref:TRAP transporter large permease n=1 Tax=Oleispirillum naphthae TaxID=2838853 RepID=UPI003082358D
MSAVQIGCMGIACVLLLAALRIPIGVALGGTAAVGVLLIRGQTAALSILGAATFDFAAHWTMTAVPMFLFMGNVAYHSGLATMLYRAARAWLSFLPGGLALATTCASAGFAATSGSSVAMAGAMSRLAVPEMLRAGYDKGLASGVVAASGTLGALIPPSIHFILYATFMETSVSKLLMAGIIPGLLTMAAYFGLVVIRTTLNPSLAPRTNDAVPMEEKLRLLAQAWPLPIIFIGIIGGIYSGIVTATEAGAAGSALALIVAALSGRLNRAMLLAVVKDTAGTTAAIFFIAIGAVLFSQFLTISRVPLVIGGLIRGLSDNLPLFLLMISVFYLVLGMFLDAVGLMLVTLPILAPAVSVMGIDVIWFGVIVVKFVEIGLLTPPIGLNLYVVTAAVKGQITFSEVVRGTSWFLYAEAVVMVLILSFPQLSLFIPNLMN